MVQIEDTLVNFCEVGVHNESVEVDDASVQIEELIPPFVVFE